MLSRPGFCPRTMFTARSKLCRYNLISGIKGGSGPTHTAVLQTLPQVKLQQQKLHLGPPPLVLSTKRAEDLESGCQDESLSHGLPNNSGIDITTSPTFDKVGQVKRKTKKQKHVCVSLLCSFFRFIDLFKMHLKTRQFFNPSDFRVIE